VKLDMVPSDQKPEIQFDGIFEGLGVQPPLCNSQSRCRPFPALLQLASWLNNPQEVLSLRSPWGLAQQKYAKSHRILANCRGVKDFRRFRNSQDGTWFSRSVLRA
jgi:hypothetical protein